MWRRIKRCWRKEGLLRGKTVGVDATTLEANAAMRSIVRRDMGEGYEELLRWLTQESPWRPDAEESATLDCAGVDM